MVDALSLPSPHALVAVPIFLHDVPPPRVSSTLPLSPAPAAAHRRWSAQPCPRPSPAPSPDFNSPWPCRPPLCPCRPPLCPRRHPRGRRMSHRRGQCQRYRRRQRRWRRTDDGAPNLARLHAMASSSSAHDVPLLRTSPMLPSSSASAAGELGGKGSGIGHRTSDTGGTK